MTRYTSAAEIAQKFGFSQEPDGRWRGACTAHRGDNPRALSIWDGAGGSIGAKCYTEECSYQSLLDALGVEFTYASRTHFYGNGKGGREADREPVTRRRGPDKDLRGNLGTNRGLQVKLGANDCKSAKVVLVEGEKAFDALEAWGEVGYTPAHWVGGTSAVAHADYSLLADRTVILWPDNDEPGREAMQKAAAALRNLVAKLLIVDTSEFDEKQDAADMDGQSIKEVVENAEDLQAPESRGEDAERVASGAGFTRDSVGLLGLLQTVKLDIRQNSRGGSIELRRSDVDELEAIAFYADAGLKPDGIGWAIMGVNTASYLRDLFGRHYRDDRGVRYKLAVNRWEEAIRALLASRQVDPVTDYLRDLPPWDEVERIPTMFVDALGSEDTSLNRETARAFMVGAIRRTYEPGCQHDWLPVLIGEQGGGKTTFCRELPPPDYPEWFARLPDLAGDTQRLCEAIGNAWIVECPEIRVHDYRKAKHFIDDTRDRYRRPYAHTAEAFARGWVSIGTANDEGSGVLPDDPSGVRRYVAISVDTPGATREEQAAHVRDYLDEKREQLWAEALHGYHAGQKSYLGGEFEQRQDSVNAMYTRVNESMETIANKLTAKHAGGDPVPLSALLIDAALASDDADAATKTRSTGAKLAGVLRQLKWEKKRVTRDGVTSMKWYPPVLVTDVHDLRCVGCGDAAVTTDGGNPVCGDFPECSAISSGDTTAAPRAATLQGALEIRLNEILAERDALPKIGDLMPYPLTLDLRQRKRRSLPPVEAALLSKQVKGLRGCLGAMRDNPATGAFTPSQMNMYGGPSGMAYALSMAILAIPDRTWPEIKWQDFLRGIHAYLIQVEVEMRERKAHKQTGAVERVKLFFANRKAKLT